MIPLYGFLHGDTMGVLVLADEQETMANLAEKLQTAASLRVPARAGMQVRVNGELLSPRTTVHQAELRALDRFDVVEGD